MPNRTNVMRLVDYHLNTGTSGTFDTETVSESDMEAVQAVCQHEITGKPPFEDFRCSVFPGYGAGWFSVYHQKQRVLTSYLVTSDERKSEAWARIESHVHDSRHLHPGLLITNADADRPPTVPFLATLLLPPCHQEAQPEFHKLALRFRNAVAVSLLRGKWFELDDVRRARTLAEAMSRPQPAPCSFDPANPTPWLEYQLAQDTMLHPLAHRALVIVLRKLLTEDADVMATKVLPVADEYGAWCFFDTETNTVVASADQNDGTGILAVRENVAGFCGENEVAARALRLRAVGAGGVLNSHSSQKAEQSKSEGSVMVNSGMFS